jgi:hypothetical protein
MLDTLRELLAAANPGLASHEDLTRLEAKVDELAALIDTLAQMLEQGATKSPTRG